MTNNSYNIHCEDCVYMGEKEDYFYMGEKIEEDLDVGIKDQTIKKVDLYACNNEKSIFKLCCPGATACRCFKERESHDVR